MSMRSPPMRMGCMHRSVSERWDPAIPRLFRAVSVPPCCDRSTRLLGSSKGVNRNRQPFSQDRLDLGPVPPIQNYHHLDFDSRAVTGLEVVRESSLSIDASRAYRSSTLSLLSIILTTIRARTRGPHLAPLSTPRSRSSRSTFIVYRLEITARSRLAWTISIHRETVPIHCTPFIFPFRFAIRSEDISSGYLEFVTPS